MTAQITEKVLIYATWEARLVVFDELDFPDLLPQVPGGTIELGEAPSDAARREFTEETGLASEGKPRFLSTHDYHAVRNDRTIHHRRHFFHIPLATAPQDHWLHWELHPTGGDNPILFRFFMIKIVKAPDLLGYEMGKALDLLAQY